MSGHRSNSKKLFDELVRQLTIDEDVEEKKATIFYLLEHRLGLSKSQILAGTHIKTNPPGLETDLARLNAHEPVQYIVEKAWFYNHPFYVNKDVLVPRPDTEQIVDIVVQHRRAEAPRILDVGTGSGCLAISLVLAMEGARVSALDVSKEALTVARRNAAALQADVQFYEMDVLTQQPATDNPFDYIVSNPPYLHRAYEPVAPYNVKKYEPHLALWPPDGYDELAFYRVLAGWRNVLADNGLMVMEIDDRGDTSYLFGLTNLFIKEGFSNVTPVKSSFTGRYQFLQVSK